MRVNEERRDPPRTGRGENRGEVRRVIATMDASSDTDRDSGQQG
jgi:hypothetical protein